MEIVTAMPLSGHWRKIQGGMKGLDCGGGGERTEHSDNEKENLQNCLMQLQYHCSSAQFFYTHYSYQKCFTNAWVKDSALLAQCFLD